MKIENKKTNKPIPEGWRIVTLGEVADVQNGYAFRSDEFLKGGIPIIKIKNIASGKITIDDLDFYENNIENMKTFQINKGDILVSMTGSHISQISSAVGKVAKYNLKIISLLNQRVGKIYPKENLADNNYLWYLVSQSKVQFFWGNKAGGSANQANISPSIIKSYQFIAPPLSEQCAIAAILSSLDDKIELLREQNKTLEAIAQAIYKRWFVDFEFPVTEPKNSVIIEEEQQPKADGMGFNTLQLKGYKSSGGKMVESELGEIPEGWRVEKLREIINLTIGRTPPRKETEWFSVNPRDVKWLSIKDLGDAETYVFKTFECLTKEAIVKHRIQIVPINTVLISFKLTVGRIAITLDDMVTNEAIAHLRLPKESELTSEYLYLYFKNFNFNSIGSTSSIATAFNSESLRALYVLIPTRNILQIFDKTIIPVFKKIKNNISQIQILSALRDAMLPKLMSGKIRVPTTLAAEGCHTSLKKMDAECLKGEE
jgi:type I restriction enzyme S subunit